MPTNVMRDKGEEVFKSDNEYFIVLVFGIPSGGLQNGHVYCD